MQILYCIERINGTGGLQRILIDKMNYLAEHTAHEIILMTVWHNPSPAAFPISEKVRMVRLNVPLPRIPGGYAMMLPLALSRFNSVMKRINPDVCVVFRAVGAFLSAFTSWKGSMIYESHTPLISMDHQWIYPLMQKKVELVVCLTEPDSRSFTKAKRVEVIPNYCTIADNIDDSCRPDYASRKVISLGRQSAEKDFPRLGRIWAKVKPHFPDWELEIYHDTKDVIAAYNSGSIYAITSRFEGFSMTLIEAMHCSLPCIAFDCPYGPRDIIKDNENGYLVPMLVDGSEEKADELYAERLMRLMRNQELRQEMGRKAKESMDSFNKQTIMNRWLKTFTSIQAKKTERKQ